MNRQRSYLQQTYKVSQMSHTVYHNKNNNKKDTQVYKFVLFTIY